MEARYKRELNHNYLIIAMEEEDSNYQLKMLLSNQIEGLLKVWMKQVDGRREFYYEISSRQQLSRLLELKRLSAAELKELVLSLASVLKRVEEYLLPAKQLVLDPEYIYVNPETFRFFYCCLPGYEDGGPKAVQELMRYLLDRVNYQDQEAVTLVYRLYQETMKENFRIEDLAKSLYKKEKAAGMSPEGDLSGMRRPGTSKGEVWGKLEPDDVGENAKGAVKDKTWEKTREKAGEKTGEKAGEKIGEKAGKKTREKIREKVREDIREKSGEDIGGRVRENTGKRVGDPYGPINEERWRIPLDRSPKEQIDREEAVEWEAERWESGDSEQPQTEGCCDRVLLAVCLLAVTLIFLCALAWPFAVWRERWLVMVKANLVLSVVVEFGICGVFFLVYRCMLGELKGGNDSWEEDWETRFGRDMEGHMEREGERKADRQTEREEEDEVDEEPIQWIGETVILSQVEETGTRRRLVPLEEGDAGGVFEAVIETFPFVIGKSSGLADLILPYTAVSRVHARIDRHPDGYLITDLNSTNGTKVGDKKLEANGCAPLRVGDEIWIANVGFRFE